MFTNLVQNWRNASWLGFNLTSQIANRNGVGTKKLILKGSDTAYTYDNIGRGKFLESLDYHYNGAQPTASTVISFYFRGDPFDIFHSPDQINDYTLVAQFPISTTSIDQAQPINLYVPPWAWLYASNSSGDKWTISFTGLDSDWCSVKSTQAQSSGGGAVVNNIGNAFNEITFTAADPFPVIQEDI